MPLRTADGAVLAWREHLIGAALVALHPHPATGAFLEPSAQTLPCVRLIAKSDGMSLVAGVACFNDVSMRDGQMRGEQRGPDKNVPASGPFGPYRVTLDETGPLEELALRTILDGQVMQRSKLDCLIVDIPMLIASARAAAGRCDGQQHAGRGGFHPQAAGAAGAGQDSMVEIDRVGRLENPVIAE